MHANTTETRLHAMNATLENYTSPARENARAVHLASESGATLRVFFSYKTPIAFSLNGSARVVRENDWSTTTGRHLSAIDGGSKQAKAARIPGQLFEARLALAFAEFSTGGEDTTRERLAKLGEETLRELRERGQTQNVSAGESRGVDGMARDGFHKLGAYARAQGFFGEVQS